MAHAARTIEPMGKARIEHHLDEDRHGEQDDHMHMESLHGSTMGVNSHVIIDAASSSTPRSPRADASSDFCRAFDRLRPIGWRAALRAALAAAILGQVADESIHHRKIDRVKQLAAHALLGNQSGSLQVLEVEGQRGRLEANPVADGAGRQTFRAARDEQAINGQTMFVGECAQGGDDYRGFHDDMILRVLS